MPTLSQSGVSIGDAVVAIYIGADGSIVASEKLSGPRSIECNQLEGPASESVATEIIACEISAALKKRTDCSDQNFNFTTRRICYDKFGNRVPCF